MPKTSRAYVMNIQHLHIKHHGETLVDIAFEIRNSLALIGESGSGKSLTLKALLGMLPQEMECSLRVEANFKLQAGTTLAFVPQNPFTALSPLSKIEKQFFGKKERILELFELLSLDSALLKRFASELSGGQLQRVVIAMALESHPKLLLLDEPTTALDPQTKLLILKLLKELQKKEGFEMLFVTHDIVSAKHICDEVCIIQKGTVVESGLMDDVLSHPKQSYTKTLIDASFAQRKFRE